MPENTNRLEHLGTGSHIAGYDVFLAGDTVTVLGDDGVVTRRTVKGWVPSSKEQRTCAPAGGSSRTGWR